MKVKTKRDRRQRIKLRIRRHVLGTLERPRLAVSRSLSHISVQVIDDLANRTLVAASSREPTVKARLVNGARGSNRAGAELVGTVIAERSIERGITRVVFDRGGFLYHGRIRSVADAARKAGLEF